MRTVLSYSSCCRQLLTVLFGVLLLNGVATPAAWAQPTPGLIFKPATAGNPGAAVLDPNGDGYVSASASGFTAAGDLGTLSELPYKYLPQRISTEPMSDLRVGPSTKFTDFADVTGGGSSAAFYVQPNVPPPATPTEHYYMFRFRLGGAAPNSKGYSIAIDTDNKFGFTGATADPNAVAGNPGFEMEITLASNFGVRLYNIDGTITPNGSGPDGSLIQLPYESYAQKSIAATTNAGDLDVFYDFYIPLSVIQAQFGSRTFFNSTGNTAVPFSLSTSLRMVANTIIAPHSVTKTQNISDIGGVAGTTTNPDNDFTDLITGTTPVTGGNLPPGNVILPRAAAPTVNCPILRQASTLSGTSTEAAGTIITVYVNGTALGTTATVQAGGTWTLSGLATTAVPSGAIVKATATVPVIGTASAKSESLFSNECQASTAPGQTACATAAPSAPICTTDKNIGGYATTNSYIYLRYLDGTLVPARNVAVTNGNVTTNPEPGSPQTPTAPVQFNPVRAIHIEGTMPAGQRYYQFTSSGGNIGQCNSGTPGAFSGAYLVSVASGVTAGTINASPCESAGTQICVNTVGTTATPTVTTTPINTSTTSITGGTSTAAGATVFLYVDGSVYSKVTAAAGSYTFSTAGGTLPLLTEGRVLTFYASTNTTCLSAGISRTVLSARTLVPPVVSSPIAAGASTVKGTSVEAAGSTITLTVYGNTAGTGLILNTFTTTVQADGTWTVSGIGATVLLANRSVKATVTPVNNVASGFSNVVPVQATTTSIPYITNSYVEKGTSVTGFSNSLPGTIITVYEDGFAIGTATVVAGGGGTAGGTLYANSWTLTGLSNGSGISPNTAYPDLYAGGVLTATATEGSNLPSALSNAVTVGCATIANKSFVTSAICAGNTATFTVSNVEPGVVYTLQENVSNANVGTSKVGTGTGTSSLTFTTPVYNTAGSYAVKLNAFSVGAATCSSNTTPITLTVNPLPLTRTIAPNDPIATPQAAKNGIDIVVQTSESGISYQLVNTSVTPNANVGAPKEGTGSNLSLYTGPISTTSASTAYNIVGTNILTGCQQTVASRTVNYSGPLPVELSYFEAQAKNGNAALTWRTASEKNNDHFTIERSADGREFTAIGQVAGHGNSSQPHAYTYHDAGAARFGNRVYYRLQQVDTDGSTSVSPVRAVAFAEGAAPATVLLYPNPATSSVTCSLALLPVGTYSVQVLSMTGKTVQSASLTAEQPRELNLADVPAGVYVVRVQGGGLSLSQRLVKLR